MPNRPAYKQMMEIQRRQNAVKEQNQRYMEENRQTLFKAQWENKTDAKLTLLRKKDRLAQLRKSRQDQILQRKRKLAELLNREMQQWQDAVKNSRESTEDRKASIAQRAIALRDAREAERKEFVEQCYRDQYRNACDDARFLDAKALTKYVMDEREKQIEMKHTRREELRRESEALDRQCQERLVELDEKESEKERTRRQMEFEIRGILDGQTANLRRRKEALRQQQAEDAAIEHAEWKAAMDKEQEEQSKRTALAYARGRAIREFNESRKHLRREAEAHVREQDMMLLQYALDKEKADEMNEARKREEEKETTKVFQEYLKAQMIKEAQNDALVEELRKAEEDRIWERKEGEQRKRDEARAYLMRITNEGRQTQIEEKRKRHAEELAYEGSENEYMDREQAELDRIEADKEARRRLATDKNLAYIKGQIAAKERARRREEQEKFLETKIMERNEEEHRRQLAEQAGRLKLYHPIKHTSWYT